MTDKEKNKKETQAKEKRTGSAYIANSRIHVFNARLKKLLDEAIEEDVKLKED